MVHAHLVRLASITLALLVGVVGGSARAERVTLETEDGFELVGDLLPGEPESPAVILLHMYQSSRTAWAPLAPKLRGAGYTVLAIDQRTHGESIRRAGETVRVAELPPGAFGDVVREGVRDVAAARALLAARGLGGGGIALVGASYGCSVALLSASSGIGALVLLSPGTGYFGVSVLEAAAAYAGPLLAVAAEDDRNVAAEARAIVEAHASPDELVVYPTGGHGTRLFAPRPEVMASILEFLGASLPR